MSSNLSRLQKLFLDSPVEIVSTLANVVRGSEEVDLIARAIAVFVEDKNSYDVLRWCIRDHVDNTDQYQDLFRDRTLSTQILSEWCTTVCRFYMRDSLGSVLKKLASLKKALEADPRVIVANLDDNRAKLRELAEEIVQNMIQTAKQCPAELKRLLAFMSTSLSERFSKERLRVMTVFLFSRVFIPPLLNPAPFHILKETWTPEAARTGILLAKVLSNLASGVSFEEHNPLQVFNDFLVSFREKIDKFVEDLVTHADGPDHASERVVVPAETSANAFKCIHYFLYWSKDAIVAYRNQESLKAVVPTSVARLFFDLLGIVEEIELSEGKPDPIDITMLDLDNPSPGHQSGKRSPTKLMSKPAAIPRPRPERAVSVAHPATSEKQSSAESSSNGPQMVRRISEKWNRQLQLDAIRQKQEREAAEKRAQNRTHTLQKPHVAVSSAHATHETKEFHETHPTDTAKVATPKSAKAKETDSKKESDAKERASKDKDKDAKKSSSDSSPASPKERRRKLSPSLSLIHPKKSHRNTVSFGPESPSSSGDQDGSDSRDSSASPSRKSGRAAPTTSGLVDSPAPPPLESEKISQPEQLPLPAQVVEPVSPGRSLQTPKATTSPQDAITSPKSNSTPDIQAPARPESPPPLDKNVESLSTVVRNLGVENAQLAKQNKELALKVEAQQLEISRLHQELASVQASENRLRMFNSRLGQAVKLRKERDHRIKQAQTKSIYGMYHSVDDAQLDFAKATPQERLEWIFQVVGQLPSATKTHRRTSSSSTPGAPVAPLPAVSEILREELEVESTRSEEPPSSTRSDSPREAASGTPDELPALPSELAIDLTKDLSTTEIVSEDAAKKDKKTRKTKKEKSSREPELDKGSRRSKKAGTLRKAKMSSNEEEQRPRSNSDAGASPKSEEPFDDPADAMMSTVK